MAKILTATDFEKDVMKSNDIVLVDFFASWCGPCQILIPIIDEIEKEAPEGTSVYKIDVDLTPEIASNYGVMSIPALKIFKKGAVVAESTGVQSKEDILHMLEQAKQK